MEHSCDPATTDTTPNKVTLGDLCYAIAKGRVSTKRRGTDYALRLYDVRRWQRQEESLRFMLAPLADSLSIDLGGFA